MDALAVADSEAHTYAGISPQLWQELKANHPAILRPCARTKSGRSYYLKDDIKAALIANKSTTASKPIIPRPSPPFLAHA
jgi:hypothetical protein